MFLKKYQLMCVCLLLTLQCLSQDGWTLQKDKNGIKVYTKDIDSSKYKLIKVEAVLNGTIEKFDAIMQDVDNHKKWIYNTKVSKLVLHVNENRIIYYTETTLPWPFENRDVVIDMRISKNSANHSEYVGTINIDTIVSIKKGIMRIPFLKTEWNVRQDGSNLKIEYYFSTDPGANLSPWLVNTFSGKGPYETFMNLAELLKSDK